MGTIFLLFITFFRIGLFTFGGGYAMIPLMQELVTEVHQWIEVENFLDIIAIAEMTPGVIAVNMATFIGQVVTGHPLGGMITTLGVVIPSFIIVYILTHYFNKFKDNERFKQVLQYIRIGIPGIIATALFALYEGAIVDYISIIITIVTIYLMTIKKANPILIILAAGIVGAVVY